MAKFPRSYYRDSEGLSAKGASLPTVFCKRSWSGRCCQDSEARRERVRVVFRNPSASERREVLVAQFRPSQLTLLSVPNEFDAQAAVLWPAIVEHCGGLGRRRIPNRSGSGPVYDFLGGIGEVPTALGRRTLVPLPDRIQFSPREHHRVPGHVGFVIRVARFLRALRSRVRK